MEDVFNIMQHGLSSLPENSINLTGIFFIACQKSRTILFLINLLASPDTHNPRSAKRSMTETWERNPPKYILIKSVIHIYIIKISLNSHPKFKNLNNYKNTTY